MWRCKKCGGEIKKDVYMEEHYLLEIYKNGDETQNYDDAHIDSDVLSVEYKCSNCDDSTLYVVDIEEIADWIE